MEEKEKRLESLGELPFEKKNLVNSMQTKV
jgi:hypothetical protein